MSAHTNELSSIFSNALAAAQDQAAQIELRLKEDFETRLQASEQRLRSIYEQECAKTENLRAENEILKNGCEEFCKQAEMIKDTCLANEAKVVALESKLREVQTERSALKKALAAQGVVVCNLEMALSEAKRPRSTSYGQLAAVQNVAFPVNEPHMHVQKRNTPLESDSGAKYPAKRRRTTDLVLPETLSPIPDPPTGFGSWREFYSHHNLAEFAKLQSVKNLKHDEYKRAHFQGRRSVCRMCYKVGMPSLHIERSTGDVAKTCIWCLSGTSGGRNCKFLDPDHIETAKAIDEYPFDDTTLQALADLHNAAIERGKDPGRWMGEEEFDYSDLDS
ncbi:hypothetical protein FB45DRAFT_898138 [Roridomyces roridus]|uniref:Uncharacterized protein n=1 Tax=Roridomyces roridus TaxID=1738132 RepID=A0AAD7FYT2_9AGAR|nr:hypothetical protein FB45DRAFT_898138 [Roridomyces roridus]